MVAQPLIDSLSALSVEQRLEVLDWLRSNLEGGDISEAHRRILDARLDAFEADPTSGSSWSDVETRLRAGLSRP